MLNELPRHENFWRGDGLASRVLNFGKRERQVLDFEPLLVSSDCRENPHVRSGQLAWCIPDMHTTSPPITPSQETDKLFYSVLRC